jgi:hypothetical protein
MGAFGYRRARGKVVAALAAFITTSLAFGCNQRDCGRSSHFG